MLSFLLKPKLIAGIAGLVLLGGMFGWAQYERHGRVKAQEQVQFLTQVRDELALRLADAQATLRNTISAHNNEVESMRAEGERIKSAADAAIAKAAKARAKYMLLAERFGGPVRDLDTDALARIAAEEGRNREFIEAFQGVS